MSALLPFVEAFGPTLQGEGPAAGQRADFLRFGGCNLSCSWCDSAYTWDATRFDLREQIEMLSADEVLHRASAMTPLMIVTGGEPLLNQSRQAFIDVLAGLKERGQTVHIETNGTIVPNAAVRDLVDVFIVSPKQPHAGEHKRSQNPALAPLWRTLHDNTESHLKIVVETGDDVLAAAIEAERHDWPSARVWVMPEGTTADVLNVRWPIIADAAARYGVNATHRLHVLAWSDVRGH